MTERRMASHFTDEYKSLVINGKKYKVRRLRRYATQNYDGDRRASYVSHIPLGMLHCDGSQSDATKSVANKIKNIHDIDELEGFANRRKVLGVDLPKWSEEERRLILMRKYELEKQHGTRAK
tara:strand:+ start:520 stop:885 length:366 start_codon:yes stop_codon:yes gene_type:complete